jgi:2-polyprenyl-3-methyl-5-hydroxy-6-metoxy-1,4-benzoquinol methylase
VRVTTPGAARYDEVAADYAAANPDVYDTEPGSTLLQLTGPLTGRPVLDLACGHGRFARELARRGANVVGLDLSGELIAMARGSESEQPLGIEYVQGDAASTRVLEGRWFDVVVSSFGLSDIDDLDGALTAVARLLRPGGAFVFSILHPCFPGRPPNVSAAWPPSLGYFHEGRWVAEGALSTLRQQVGANHRMMSTLVNALVAHGLPIERILEPEPPEDWVDSVDLPEPVPLYLVVRCRTTDDPTSDPNPTHS